MRNFNPSASREERALQAYLILIGLASNRQTITYKGLSIWMHGHPAQGTLAGILGCIAYYCEKWGMPMLTTIVVNETSGEPGPGIPYHGTLAEERENVYRFNWYDVQPPTPEEFAKALKENT